MTESLPSSQMTYHDAVPEATGDGSTTLYSQSFHQPYHNRAGAASESRYLFLEMTGLTQYFNRADRSAAPLHILEIGFGTGLNLAVLMEQMAQIEQLEQMADVESSSKTEPLIHYYSVEGYPPTDEVMDQMNYGLGESMQTGPNAPSTLFKNLLREASPGWNHALIQKNLHVHLLIGTFEEFAHQDRLSQEIPPIDLFFHDPFSPETNPAGWSVSMFERLRRLASQNALLSTYSASSAARAAMASAGWLVARAPGALNKREMTLASVSPEPLSHLKRVNESRLKERFENGDFKVPNVQPSMPENQSPQTNSTRPNESAI